MANAKPYFSGVTPATADALPTSGGKSHVPPAVWNQLMDNFVNWKFPVNAGGNPITNVQRITFADGATIAPGAIPSDYDFTPQEPGGSLSVGSNTITLTPVPLGVNAANTGCYLYIYDGTGTPEAVPITGGTAVSGGASGTVIVTCTNTHSGAWKIKSATAGIQESLNALTRAWVRLDGEAYDVYASILVPERATIEGPGAGSDSNTPPCIINYKPLTGSCFVISADHVTLKGFALRGDTAGTPTTSIGIDISGTAPRSAITCLLQDLYVRGFGTGYLLDTLSNPSAYRCSAFANVSHGFHFTSVQGYFIDLLVQSNGGDGIHIRQNSAGNNASPFLLGLHSHNNQGWAINTQCPLNLTKFYINFDKAGEILYDNVTGVLPGTINDGHIEEAGNSPTYGVSNTAPGIRVTATAAGGLNITDVQINSNQGNGIEFLGGSNKISDSNLQGNGAGGQAGSTHNIYATVGSVVMTTNISVGTHYFAGNGQTVSNNEFGGNSANPVLDFASGISITCETNRINQSGAGASIRGGSGVIINGPFHNNISAGAVDFSAGAAVQVSKDYIAPNFIPTETGSANAIAGSIAAVPLVAGLRVIVKLAHSLQAGANTFNYNGGGAVAIKRHTTLGDLNVAYIGGSFIDLMYDGTYWEDMGQ